MVYFFYNTPSRTFLFLFFPPTVIHWYSMMISLHPIKPHFLLVCFRRRSKLLSSTRILYTTYMFILYVLLNVCLYTYTHRINIPGTSGRYLSYSAFCFVSDCIFISLRRSKSKYTFLDIYDFPRCVIKYHCNGFDLFL